jgi:hypothetical protein
LQRRAAGRECAPAAARCDRAAPRTLHEEQHVVAAIARERRRAHDVRPIGGDLRHRDPAAKLDTVDAAVKLVAGRVDLELDEGLGDRFAPPLDVGDQGCGHRPASLPSAIAVVARILARRIRCTEYASPRTTADAQCANRRFAGRGSRIPAAKASLGSLANRVAHPPPCHDQRRSLHRFMQQRSTP